MKKSRKLMLNKKITLGALTAAVAVCCSLSAFAASFNDVPQTFWAYEAIDRISSQGIMVGDLSGNFNPDSYIDKFETSKMLAKILGYNYAGASETDKAYYDKTYEQNKSFIEQYEKAFTKWNSTADREIAFLMDKGILKTEDLNQFVIKDSNGTEYLRALSREEYAVFIVRVMGKTQEAANYAVTEPFADDASIASSKKQSVYYLRSINVISGTTDGKFNPKGAVTRADFCVLTDKALNIMGKTVSTAANNTADIQSNVNVNNIETVSGTIDKYFPSLNVVQINTGAQQKLYKVTAAAEIKIDGFLSALTDLKEGMQATVVLNNSEIVNLNASTQGGSGEVMPEVSSENTNQTQGSDENAIVLPQVDKDTLTEIQVRIISAADNSITVSRIVSAEADNISREELLFTVDSSSAITENGAAVSVGAIEKNSLAVIKALGSKIYSMEIQPKEADVDGELIAKGYNSTQKAPILIIKDEDKKLFEYLVDTSADISRNNDTDLKYTDLKIGDTLRIKTEDSMVVYADAEGGESTIEGYVSFVSTGGETPVIGISESSDLKNAVKYPYSPETTASYALRVGDKIRANIDSREVTSVNLRKSADISSVTGTIVSVKDKYVLIEAYSLTGSSRKKIYYDNDTTIISAISGKTIKARELDEDMVIYAYLDEDDSDRANYITLISNN